MARGAAKDAKPRHERMPPTSVPARMMEASPLAQRALPRWGFAGRRELGPLARP
jgi:hypothetical protein